MMKVCLPNGRSSQKDTIERTENLLKVGCFHATILPQQRKLHQRKQLCYVDGDAVNMVCKNTLEDGLQRVGSDDPQSLSDAGLGTGSKSLIRT
ncbi:unnamed protein product [Rhodiola kirilowii]